MDKLELVIMNPTTAEMGKRIDWNKEAMYEFLNTVVANYSGVVYSDEQIKEAKNDRAQLNALKKDISARRIEVKKAIMQPYTDFEKELDEVTAELDKTIAQIDEQVKAYENDLKEKKKAAIKETFDANVGDLEVEFEQLFDNLYLTQKVTLKKAQEDILKKLNQIREDLAVIDNIEGKYKLVGKEHYLRTFNISESLSMMTQLEQKDKAEEERKKKLEEERIRQEEARKAAEEERERKAAEERIKQEEARKLAEEEALRKAAEEAEKATEIEQPKEEPKEEVKEEPKATVPTMPVEEDKIVKASFTIYCRRSELEGFKQYMIDHNIQFGKVER